MPAPRAAYSGSPVTSTFGNEVMKRGSHFIFVFGLLGWVLFIGATFQIQHVEVWLDSGKTFKTVRIMPPWKHALGFHLSEAGHFKTRTSYVYGLYQGAGLVGGGKVISHD